MVEKSNVVFEKECFVKIHRKVLSNGLRTLVVPKQDALTVHIALGLRAGARREIAETNGIAHFLEHMFFRGGTRYPTQDATAIAIEGVGGNFNAYTSYDMVYFIVSMPVGEFETGMDVLGDMLLNAVLRQEDIVAERGAVLQEFARRDDSSSTVAWEALQRLLYGNAPLGWPIVGSLDNLNRFAREDFVRFRTDMYNAREAVLVVSGNVDASRVQRLAEKYFGVLPASSNACGVSYEAPAHMPGPQSVVIQRDFKQVTILLGTYAPTVVSNDRFAVYILDTVLGTGMSSRLFQNVRTKKGLAYGVSSNYGVNADYATFSCGAGVSPERVEEALEAIVVEMKKLVKEPPTAEELSHAKRFRAGHLSMSADNAGTIVGWLLGSELMLGQARTPLDVIHDTDGVTRYDVMSRAQTIFLSDAWKMAVVGPYAGSEDTIRDIVRTTLSK